MNKKESVYILIVLLAVGVATWLNIAPALRRARDLTRKNDIMTLNNALGMYATDFGVFPPALNGKIVACGKKGSEPCAWGKDAFRDVNDLNYPSYIERLPLDPSSKIGASYVYFSDGRHYQILASLEGKDEDEFDPKIAARKVLCGNVVCNFGKSSGGTPLDKSLEEYQAELDAANEAARRKLMKKTE